MLIPEEGAGAAALVAAEAVTKRTMTKEEDGTVIPVVMRKQLAGDGKAAEAGAGAILKAVGAQKMKIIMVIIPAAAEEATVMNMMTKEEDGMEITKVTPMLHKEVGNIVTEMNADMPTHLKADGMVTTKVMLMHRKEVGNAVTGTNEGMQILPKVAGTVTTRVMLKQHKEDGNVATAMNADMLIHLKADGMVIPKGIPGQLKEAGAAVTNTEVIAAAAEVPAEETEEAEENTMMK